MYHIESSAKRLELTEPSASNTESVLMYELMFNPQYFDPNFSHRTINYLIDLISTLSSQAARNQAAAGTQIWNMG